MWRTSLMLAVLMAALVAPPTVRAQTGNGLYAPFPSDPSRAEVASPYYEALGLRVGQAQLARGEHTRELPARPASAGPAQRAGVGVGGLGADVVVLVAVALVAGLTVPAVRSRQAR